MSSCRALDRAQVANPPGSVPTGAHRSMISTAALAASSVAGKACASRTGIIGLAKCIMIVHCTHVAHGHLRLQATHTGVLYLACPDIGQAQPQG